MRTVFKYKIDDFGIKVPGGSKVVLIGRQGCDWYVWLDHETTAQPETRIFTVVGTGHPIPDGATHVGSFQDPPFVWHVYELAPEPRPVGQEARAETLRSIATRISS